MRRIDKTEVGCIAIIGGIKVVEVIDSIVGERGSAYFICRALYQDALILYKPEDLKPLFAFAEGELGDQTKGRDFAIFDLISSWKGE